MNDTQKMYVKAKADTAAPATKDTSTFVPVTASDMLRSFLVGVLVGVITTGLFYLLNHFIFGAALCRAGIQGCSSAPLYSWIIATVVGVIGGIIALAKAGIYRPLPVAIAVSIALWGMFGGLADAKWYWGLVVGAVLFGLAYLLFAWLSRMRSFIISLIILAIVAIAIRLIVG